MNVQRNMRRTMRKILPFYVLVLAGIGIGVACSDKKEPPKGCDPFDESQCSPEEGGGCCRVGYRCSPPSDHFPQGGCIRDNDAATVVGQRKP